MTARSTNGGENWEVPSTFVSKKNWKSVIFSGYVTTSTDGLNWTTPEQIRDESGKIVTASLNGICAMS